MVEWSAVCLGQRRARPATWYSMTVLAAMLLARESVVERDLTCFGKGELSYRVPGPDETGAVYRALEKFERRLRQ